MSRVSLNPQARAAAAAYWAKTHGPSIAARAYDLRAAEGRTPETVAELLDAVADLVRCELVRSGAAASALDKLKARDAANPEKKRRLSVAAFRAPDKGNVIAFPKRVRPRRPRSR